MKIRVEDPASEGTSRRLELIEALAIGIDGKQALWRALQKASSTTPGNGSLDYDRLIARAQAQRQLVEGERRLDESFGLFLIGDICDAGRHIDAVGSQHLTRALVLSLVAGRKRDTRAAPPEVSSGQQPQPS